MAAALERRGEHGEQRLDVAEPSRSRRGVALRFVLAV